VKNNQPINVLSNEVIAIYVRVSTEEQLKGYSIEGQIEDCIKKAGTSKVLIYKDEGITGEIINRPGLMRLQDDIEKGLIQKVICYDPDRLSRKLYVQLMITQQFQKHNVELVFVNSEYKDTPEGMLYFQIRGAFSEFDKAKIKHNTMTGRVRKAKKGLVVKNSKLYGYNYNKDKNMYELNEFESKIVKMIFDHFTNPDSPFKGINGIAVHLTDIGIPTKRGAKQWHRQVVRQILLNEAYTGTYYQNKFNTEGNYVARQAGEKTEVRIRPEEEWLVTKIPPIITQEQYDYAQELLKQSRRRHTKESFHKYLLSGLVRCGQCGATMTGRRRLSHGKDFFIYTGRKNYAGNTSTCRREMSENKLNNIVWTHLIELFNNPDKLNEFSEETEQTNYLQLEIEMLEKEIEKTKKGQKRLITLVSLSEEDLNLDEIKDQIRDLQHKENELTKQYTLLTEQIKENVETKPNEDVFAKAAEVYLQKKADFSFEDKQKLIQMMVKQVLVYDKDTVEIQLF
jgi:site-specific DNA recombinase